MIRSNPGRLALVLSPAFLLAACASWCGPTPAQDLANRMQVQLAPDIAAGRVAFQQLPDGARVTLLDPTSIPSDTVAPDPQEHDVLVAVIQGLVAPRLLRIAVADGSADSGGSSGPRAQAVTQYFEEHLLGSALQPRDLPQGMPVGAVGPAPQGLTITVSVVSG